MSLRNSGHTTAPALSASLAGERADALTLRWLFPKTDGPSLVLSQAADEVFIGRDDACALPLSGQEVSRRHAAIRRQGPHSILVDLGSRNGTWVNGRAIQSVLLSVDDVVRIGGWVGVVTRDLGPLGTLAPGIYGGQSLREALEPAQRAAASDLPIILQGETGTGKEAVARAIHAWSARSGPFTAVNCAALPEALAEGELFGYRRGAFTGADRANLGYFRAAQGGSLLLDEVCELPLVLQAKLLRVLEEREVQPLGEPKPIKLDVRVLAAAQSDLAEEVARGRFRADLFARLDGLTIPLAPLRARRSEIPYLFTRLLVEASGARPPTVEAGLVERLCLYDWPFNVRELSLLVKRLVVLHGAESTLKLKHLPRRVFGAADGSGQLDSRSVNAADAVSSPAEPPDFAALLEALRSSQGNVARAAQLVGISRQRAYRMMLGHPEVDLDAIRGAASEP